MTRLLLVMALAMPLGLWSCNEDEDGAGQAMTRTLKGTLIRAAAYKMGGAQLIESAADTVMATDLTGASHLYPLQPDGTFAAELQRDMAYVVSFIDSTAQAFVAVLLWDQRGQAMKQVPTGQDDIDLGPCSLLAGGTASPTRNPLGFTDGDQDGQPDEATWEVQPALSIEGTYDLTLGDGRPMTIQMVALGDGEYLLYMNDDGQCFFAQPGTAEVFGDGFSFFSSYRWYHLESLCQPTTEFLFTLTGPVHGLRGQIAVSHEGCALETDWYLDEVQGQRRDGTLCTADQPPYCWSDEECDGRYCNMGDLRLSYADGLYYGLCVDDPSPCGAACPSGCFCFEDGQCYGSQTFIDSWFTDMSRCQ